MKKDTSKLLEELCLCEEFSTFYEKNENNMVSDSLPQMLDMLLKKKLLTKAKVIRDSELSDIYAYQIFSGIRKPDRKKLLSLAVALHATLDEVQWLLKSSGYPPLYAKKLFDSVVLYGICKNMSVVQINELLFEYDLETLG